MNNLIKAGESSPNDPWGKASDRRGIGYTEIAKEFLRDHPVGSVLSASAFDQWLADHELLIIPNPDLPKNSDGWLGHLQRRHIIRGRINNSATHPRMRDEGADAFIITATRGGFEVRSPNVAAAKTELAKKVATLAETKRKQLAYLMQSADWPNIPPHERAVAEAIYDDIEAFAEDTRISADRISRKLAKLEHRVRQAMDAGHITSTNGGIKQLLAGLPDESSMFPLDGESS